MTWKKLQPDYKWVILAVCFLMEFICLGFCSSNPGLYTASVTAALGIDRTVYSLAGSIRYSVQVLVALSFGTLVNRFGVKKMTVAGLGFLIGATLLRATGTHYLHFFLAGALHGVGMVFAGSNMAGTIVRRWFHQDIGRYTGIVMSANGIGGAVASQIVSPIINNGEVFGYRKAYLLATALSLVISAVILVFLRDKPGDAPVGGSGQKKVRGRLWTGIEYHAVKKKPYFYVSAALVFLTGISLQSIGNITIVYMTDLGISPGFIAATATVGSLALTFTKLMVGLAYDKKGLRFALLMCQLAAVTTFMMKGFLTNTNFGLVLAMTSTVLSYVAAPLETVLIPLLTNDLFGSASYMKILGVFTAMNSLGLCLGTPLGELIRKFMGSYRPCFWFFTVIMVAVIIGFQVVLRVANKEKAAILEAETV